MKKLPLILCAAVGIAFMALPPSANAQCTYTMNDVGRFHGYLSGPCNGAALGYAGAYRPHYNTAAGFNSTANAPKPAPQVNNHHIGCDSVCQQKCQATWQGHFRSVGACYAKWATITNAGRDVAVACTTSTRAQCDALIARARR
jgi:hypothetical protein